YTEDCEHVDHRSDSTWSDMQSLGDILTTLRQAVELTPDIRVRTEIIATDDESLVAYRQIFNASADGAPLELAIVDVARLRNGKVCHIEAYEPDDEAAVLARFEELRGSEAERVLAAYVRTYNERDWDAMAPLFP